jgi:heterodisulfide reductase subunit C
MASVVQSGTDFSQVNELFLKELSYVPEWEKIKACIQCGTCTASCPTSWAMEYKPREIVGLFRAEMLDKVLRSNTVWMCASCYYCAVRCPSGIKLADIMYVLRSLAIKHGLFRREEAYPALARMFAGVVDRYGRNAETEMLTRYYLSRKNPFGMAKQLGLALKMLRRGRLPLLPKAIRGQRDLEKIMARLKQEESE